MTLIEEAQRAHASRQKKEAKYQQQRRQEEMKRLRDAMKYAFGGTSVVRFDETLRRAVAEKDGLEFTIIYEGATAGVALVRTCPDCGSRYVDSRTVSVEKNSYGAQHEKPLRERKPQTLLALGNRLAKRRDENHVCYQGAARSIAHTLTVNARALGVSVSQLAQMAVEEAYRQR